MIIDADKSSRMALSLLIRQNHLGNVIAQLESEENAVEDILFYRPDILLIDFMMYERKGLEIIEEVIKRGYSGKIIVASAGKEEDIITRAYEAGILFYLTKPINPAEAISVLSNAEKMIELERAMSQIKGIIYQTDQDAEKVKTAKQDIGEQLYDIFTEIGIIGLSGTDEIREVIKSIYRIQKLDRKQKYHLKDIYREVCIKMHGDVNQVILQKNMEQRIRRTIQKALGNLAEMGCEDYYDPIFTKYANVLFDFKQVRQEMQHVKDPHAYAGKINTKKFMEGILSRVD